MTTRGPDEERDSDRVERFLADLRLVGRQYVRRAPEDLRPLLDAEMDQCLTEARMRLGQPLQSRD